MKSVVPLLAAMAAAGLFAAALGVNGREARNDRQWETALSRAPVFEPRENGRWLLRDMRAFAFSAEGPAREAWRDVMIDPADLEEIWFFVEPFDGFDGAAHTLISFVFGGATAQTLAISVEARKEQGETYSGLRGVFNAYELIYQWSSEKDVLTRIAVTLNHEIYAYRLKIDKLQARQVLAHFIARTNALAETPRFYNTLTSNCTNELAKAAARAFPQALPWHYSHVLTGYAAQRLHALGFIGDRAMPFDALKSAARAGDAIRGAQSLDDEAFAQGWRRWRGGPR